MHSYVRYGLGSLWCVTWICMWSYIWWVEILEEQWIYITTAGVGTMGALLFFPEFTYISYKQGLYYDDIKHDPHARCVFYWSSVTCSVGLAIAVAIYAPWKYAGSDWHSLEIILITYGLLAIFQRVRHILGTIVLQLTHRFCTAPIVERSVQAIRQIHSQPNFQSSIQLVSSSPS